MAQLVEWSLPTPEIRSLNPVIGKLLYRTFNCLSTVNCIEKTKIKKKEAGNGPKNNLFCHNYAEIKNWLLQATRLVDANESA